MSRDNNDRVLFRRYVDQLLDRDEFLAMEKRLAEDPLYRRHFVEFMDFEASLYEEAGSSLAPVRLPSRSIRRPYWKPLLAVASVMTVACLLSIWVMYDRRPAPHVVRSTHYIEAQLRGLKDVAVITHVEGIGPESGAGLRHGASLRPGVLTLTQGRVQLQFLCGATVLLQGPAEIHLLSSSAATMVRGTASSKVPPVARGFVLNAPEAAIVDLGTEFGLNVNELGISEVYVQSGQVEASLLGEDGNTLVSERLDEKQTVLIDPYRRRMDRLQSPRTQFPTVLEADHSAFMVTAEYEQMIRQAKPLLYWRFEEYENGVIPNEVGPQWPGRILHSPGAEAAIVIEQGTAKFLASEGPRYILADGMLPDFNNRSYSMELWLKPETLHWGAILNVMTPTELAKRNHLSFLELAHETNLVHEPGVVRFLHRFPPGLRGGVNLFSKEICTPGQWYHVAAVKEPNEMRLYVNGQLIRKYAGKIGEDHESYRLLVGQLGGTTNERQYLGLIDELAIYARVLTAEEVALHYYAVVSVEPEG